MRTKHLVVIGTSGGGIEALRSLVAALPADFPAAICVVLHMSPHAPEVLPAILDRAGPLRAVHPNDRDRIIPGRIYVAPPDRHLLIEPGVLRVTKGPTENRFRPAVDPLFRSAAQVFGPAAIGVILTGGLGDGAAGLWALKHLGGLTIVQEPDEAMFPEMPLNALRHVMVDHRVPLGAIVPLLVRYTANTVEETGGTTVPDEITVEINIAKEHNALDAGIERIAAPSSFSCPECHAVLLQLKETGSLRFRCHTGHAYSVESLLAAVEEGIEASLWTASRALDEGRLLIRRLASELRATSHHEHAQRFVERAEEARRQAEQLRQLLAQRESVTGRKPSRVAPHVDEVTGSP